MAGVLVFQLAMHTNGFVLCFIITAFLLCTCRCVDGYYRPLFVEPYAKQPCRPCVCNSFGGVRSPENTGPLVCLKDASSINVQDSSSFPGKCICKPGYTGEKCDRYEVDF